MFQQGYALVVGVSHYHYFNSLPPTVTKDARDVATLLRDPHICGYPTDQVQLLVNERSTVAEFRKGVEWLAGKVGANDTAVLYFSGHGAYDESGEAVENYLLFTDSRPEDLAKTAVSAQAFRRDLAQIHAGRLLIILDCCHAAGANLPKSAVLGSTTPQLKAGFDPTVYAQLGEGQGQAIIASSRVDELSWILPGEANSLFTTHLLSALRGSATTHGDGLIRLFDLFDYVSNQVAEQQANQHPVLKAALENNFPIALFLGGQKGSQTQSHVEQAQQVEIENYMNLSLSEQERDVLQRMYAGFDRLVIKKEFKGGFSEGRVFLARPIATNKRNLPTVLKLGPAEKIEQEWRAYSRFIQNQMTSVARINEQPTRSANSQWAGLTYQLAGDGRFYTESLKAYCRQAAIEDVLYALNKQLFVSLHDLWQQSRVEPDLHRGQRYDLVLPVNLIIAASLMQPATDNLIVPNNVWGKRHAVNQTISVSQFQISEIEPERARITLNHPVASSGQSLPKHYRIRLVFSSKQFSQLLNSPSWQVGQLMPQAISGVVQETRFTQLQAWAQPLFEPQLDLKRPFITPLNNANLPNPLYHLPDLLNQTVDMRVGSIHGDLNSENVLVEFDEQSIKVHLIDFALARRDAILHDLLRLETSIWLYLLPDEMKTAGHGLLELGALVQSLKTAAFPQSPPAPALTNGKTAQILRAIRQTARHYRATPSSWEEYEAGLIIYLLGALKFKNLDDEPTAPLPKQIAFLTAAHLLQKEQQPHSSPQVLPPKEDSNMTPQPTQFQILEALIENFNLSELRNICMELDVNFENIPGSALDSKGRELILYLKRRRRLHELTAAMVRRRSYIFE